MIDTELLRDLVCLYAPFPSEARFRALVQLDEIESILSGLKDVHTMIGDGPNAICFHCGGLWPCRTIRILDGENE